METFHCDVRINGALFWRFHEKKKEKKKKKKKEEMSSVTQYQIEKTSHIMTYSLMLY